MFDFTSTLFMYKFVFMTELLACELILSVFLKKQSNFVVRMVLSIIVLYLATFFMPSLTSNAIGLSLMFMLLFALSIVALKVCFADDFGAILFCGIIAYTVQHFTYVISNFASVLAGINASVLYLEPLSITTVKALLINLAFFFTAYAIMFIVIKVMSNRVKEIRIENIIVVLASTVLLISAVILNSIVVCEYENLDNLAILNNRDNLSITFYTLFWLYDIISCVATVVFLMMSVKIKKLEYENITLMNLWETDKENYRIRKEKIETIGIMYHDMKHRLERLELDGDVSKIKEFRSQLNKYNNFYDTGNEVIDIILSEENNYCVTHNIQLVALIERDSLLFMEKGHLYSLLENALHNAIEAAEAVNESDKRYIKLCMTKKNDMSFLSIENYFAVEKKLVLIDGIPQTTKGNEYMHGYGYKSISKIVDMYDGTINVDIKKDMFCLEIFFPMK